MYIYIYICMCVYVYIYIYIYIRSSMFQGQARSPLYDNNCLSVLLNV